VSRLVIAVVLLAAAAAGCGLNEVFLGGQRSFRTATPTSGHVSRLLPDCHLEVETSGGRRFTQGVSRAQWSAAWVGEAVLVERAHWWSPLRITEFDYDQWH